jgi:alpha-L-fucosidase 2
MRHGDFIKTGAVAAGFASSLKLLPSLAAAESDSQKPSARPGALPDDNRSADYLRRAQEGKFLPKAPLVVESSQSDAVKISPMPLAERVRRKIVPRRGYCSLAPGSGALSTKLQPDKAACDLHLLEGKPVEIHLKIGRRDPLDWANRVA